MDETTNSNDGGAWVLSRLGFAIDTYVDRQLNRPQAVYDASQAYGIDPNGQMYRVGQPTTVQTVSPISGGSSSMLLVILALAFVASRHGK